MDREAAEDAKQDFTSIPFDGITPNKLACDTTLRELPDGSWVMAMLGGGDGEPRPENHVLLTRSHDKGKTWSPMQPLDFGFPHEGDTIAMVPSELMIRAERCTLFFATHDGKFAGWKEWITRSDDSCRTWSKPAAVPGRLHDRTFVRNHIVREDGRILLPFQHYLEASSCRNPRNGVLMSADGGKTWTENGNIRISQDDHYQGWAENNIVELGDGRIAMIIRADGLGGVLYYAESKDGGKTWPEFAVKSDIPNPGSKATLYPLGGDTVALLHNPNPKGRHPLALWISFDGMKTWPYQRVLVEHSSDGPGRSLNYPDGFVSKDKQWLHFAYDDNRHRAVHYSAKLPPLHAAEPVTIDLAKRTWQGIPGLERTAKGRVYVSWFTGGPKEPAPDNTVVLSYSDDAGKTFTPPEAIALPMNDGTRCFDPTPVDRSEGPPLVYLQSRQQGHRQARRLGSHLRRSRRFAARLGPEFRVGYDGPYAFRMNKPTMLSTGEWIMPVTHATETIQSWFAGPKQLQGVGISTDEGKTWSLHGALKAPEWALECMVTELKDGRLWLLTRTGGGFLWESHSTDKGRTWSEAKASTIANPGSRFFIRRLASGNLLLVNHYKFTGRSHLTAQLSTDDGATWNDGLLLDERKGVSYPDGVQDKDGLIWITYDRDRGGAGEILLAKFKEEDVAAGRNVSGAVSLKQVVNKLDKPAQPPKLVPANWNPKAAADKVIAGLIKVTAPEVKGAHGSKLTLIGGRAYVATLADNTTPGEKHDRDSVYSALSVVNLKTMTVEAFLTTAKSGQAFTNETLPRGACYASGTLPLNEHTLRCFFCSEQPGRGQSQMYYRDFDSAHPNLRRRRPPLEAENLERCL